MTRNCPCCTTSLPLLRVSTSLQQKMWGGWSCQGCGAELNAHRQLIDGAMISPDHVRIALRPHNLTQTRMLIVLGGLGPPVLSALGLALDYAGMTWALMISAAASVVLMVQAVINVRRISKKHEITLTDTHLTWGDTLLRPDEINRVTTEGPVVLLHTHTAIHRLTPLGDSQALLSAIEEVQQVGRETGSTDDIPAELTRVRSPTAT